MSMRDDIEAAEQRALEARSKTRDELQAAFPEGQAVEHIYQRGRTGTVERAYLARTGRRRVRVQWVGAPKSTVHDAELIRRQAPPSVRRPLRRHALRGVSYRAGDGWGGRGGAGIPD